MKLASKANKVEKYKINLNSYAQSTAKLKINLYCKDLLGGKYRFYHLSYRSFCT